MTEIDIIGVVEQEHDIKKLKFKMAVPIQPTIFIHIFLKMSNLSNIDSIHLLI